MGAFAARGVETADDASGATRGEAGVAGGDEIGAVEARVSAREIAGAAAVDMHGDGLVVVGIRVFENERGANDRARFTCAFEHILVLLGADDFDGKRPRSFDVDFHDRSLEEWCPEEDSNLHALASAST